MNEADEKLSYQIRGTAVGHRRGQSEWYIPPLDAWDKHFSCVSSSARQGHDHPSGLVTA